ncbi:hypothetical protein FB107DRAFT_272442 [Schizophyllum commune]
MFDQSDVASPRLESEENRDLQSPKERLLLFDHHSPQDVLAFQQHCVLARGEIDKDSAEIDRGSAPMHALVEERNEPERIYSGAVWKCSPISRLVTDVLCEIFCFVRDEAGYSLSDAHSYVLPLAQTCRQWRSVALTQTSLWALINVSCGYILRPDFNYEARVASAVRYHLDKSGEAPLTVRINLRSKSPAIRALFAELLRWRECEIDGMAVLGDEQAVAPQYLSLERLVFCQNQGTAHFERAPRLRSYHGPITEMRLPWAQLTCLTVTGRIDLHARHLIDTLKLCTDLEFLSLHYAHVEGPAPTDTSALTPVLPRLRELRLLSPYERAAVTELRVLALIDAPALESFEICISVTDTRCDSSNALPDAKVAILSRCRALRTLSLKNAMLDRRDLHRVLASAPSVERLIWWEIEELGASNFAALADALSSSSLTSDTADDADDYPSTDAIDIILPRLSHLEISGGLTPADPDLVARLILSRAVERDGLGDATTLREVVLEYLTACNLESCALGQLRRALDSLIIRENVSQSRDVFIYEVEDEDPGFSIGCFD